MTFVQGRGDMPVMEKLRILADAAKFDVACTSSGVARENSGDGIGNCMEAGICHSFAADGRCISLLKILFTNECIFDCKYCLNRRSNDVPRAAFTPDEVCELTMEFYRRNYIEGLFLSSGIVKSPDYTMELLYETLRKLRWQYHFGGYIHVKAIPGGPDECESGAAYGGRASDAGSGQDTGEDSEAYAADSEWTAGIRGAATGWLWWRCDE